MDNKILILIIFIYSFIFTYFFVIYSIKKFLKYNHVVIDRYKKGKKVIPTLGGIPMFFGIFFSLIVSALFLNKELNINLFLFYFIVFSFCIYGLIDDLMNFNPRYDKIIVLLILSMPISLLLNNSFINLFGYTINLNEIYIYFLAPLYLMVVSNLVNLYSGFNGLQTGLSLILYVFSIIKSFMIYGFDNLIYILPLFASLIVVYFFNKYPAKLHEGNSGAFMIGAGLGAFLIINKLELFGVIILIPHIINFIMDTIILGILKKPDEKFGKLRKDGTIEPPKSMRFKSLKFLLTYYFRLKEDKAVLILYIPSIIFGIIGVIFG